MPQITLNSKQVKRLAIFLVSNQKDSFFVAKDQGAYVGATSDKDKVLFYFAGCDPEKDPDFYETSHHKFGGDDFGEFLPAEWITNAARKPNLKKMVISVGSNRITAKSI